MTYHPAPDTPLDDISFCVVDTETTGGRAESHRVIDIAVFRMEQGTIVEKMQTLLNPHRPIPFWISNLTGIDDGMVRNAPTFSEAIGSVQQMLDKGVFVAHNAGFDFSFIQHEFLREDALFNHPTLCTVKLARRLYPELLSRSLGVLSEYLYIDIADRHRAAGDAEATVYVLKEMLRVLKKDHAVKTWRELKQFEETGPLVLPEALPQNSIHDLPAEPGSYTISDAGGRVLAEGHVLNIKRRIVTYFKAGNDSAKSRRLRELAVRIDFEKL
jgi:DNA polymerase-3 subunit epsilon